MYFVVVRVWDWGDGDPKTQVVCDGRGRPQLHSSRAVAQKYVDQWSRIPRDNRHGWTCTYAVEPWVCSAGPSTP